MQTNSPVNLREPFWLLLSPLAALGTAAPVARETFSFRHCDAPTSQLRSQQLDLGNRLAMHLVRPVGQTQRARHRPRVGEREIVRYAGAAMGLQSARGGGAECVSESQMER